MSINRVTISGNLTRDPELRSTQSGMNILTFGMAVNDRRRNAQTGEWEDYANFVDCVLFGNRADFLSRTLHKGAKVFVEGKLRYSSWEREGQRRSKLEVVVDDVDFFSQRQQQGGYAQQPQQQGGYDHGSQQGGYGQQAPAYSAPAPMPTQPQQPSQGYANPAPAQQAPAAPRPAVSTPPQADVYDEDIPF
jgi:single-strand DNA-binding protein